MAEKEARLNELWQKLLEQQPTNEDLRDIISWVGPLREVAGQKLLEQQPTNEDLRNIIGEVKPLREAAGRKLLEQQPSNEDLRAIIKWVEPLREVARALIQLSKEEIIEEMKRLS